jgi:hypothetical protein
MIIRGETRGIFATDGKMFDAFACTRNLKVADMWTLRSLMWLRAVA